MDSQNKCKTERGANTVAAAAELAGEWHVTHLAGAPVIEDSQLALRFMQTGEVSGNASCNRFSGSYTAEAGSLRIGGADGNLATTRMMCPAPVMAQEVRFLQLIPAIDAYEKTADGTLIFRAAGVEVLRAEKS
jgi:heat shock protein HslJ